MLEVSRGLDGVVLTETRLSRVDGEAGELIIGGFPLEELAPRASYEETLYLLWHDRLPTAAELKELRQRMVGARNLPASTGRLLREAAEIELPPMEALRLGLDSLSLAEVDPEATSIKANLRRAQELTARILLLIAGYWRLRHGQDVVEPREDLGHAAHFLYLLTGREPEAAAARGLETYLNAVVDHGMNASTFTAG